MKKIRNDKYKINIVYDMSDLKKLGFKYNMKKSSDMGDVYSYHFPCLRYKRKIPVLYAEFSVSENGNVQVDVMNPDGNAYYPFYYIEYGNYDPIIKDIWSNIHREMKKLGIEKVVEKVPKKPKQKRRKKQNKSAEKSKINKNVIIIQNGE